MIQITKNNLDKIIDEYYQKSLTLIDNIDDINCDLVCAFDKDFEQIIKLTPYEMDELINIEGISEDRFKNFKIFYNKFRNKYAVWLIEELDIKVCPYCNREYIFKFEDSKKGTSRTIATFDHYYSKSKYPFLAISFYNLIPSCHICNSKFKHTKDFTIEEYLHPYIDDFNTKAKFHTYLKNSTHSKIDDIYLELKAIDKDDKRTQNIITTFRLNDLYQNHKDTVLELIQKREIYPDSYIDELYRNYSFFNNKEDVLRLITGGYVDDKDLGKRPLSKLIKDISEELELI